MTVPYVVNVRGWPGLDSWEERKASTGYADRLGQRNALIVHAASDAASPDSFGLGAALLVAGPSVVSGAILVADDLGDRDPAALAAVETWAATHPVCDRPGAPVWEVLTLSQFFDPKAKAGCGYTAFAPNAYGPAFTIGADLGRFFGLVAEHAAPRIGRNEGSWDVWLPGWGTPSETGSWRRASPHRPCLRLIPGGTWWAWWGPCEGKNGKRRSAVAGFADVSAFAYALDADRGGSYADHRENAGLEHSDLPSAVPVDAAGAQQLAAAVGDIRELALALDEQAARWFTTPRERSEGLGRLSLRTSSPGAIAAEISSRFRVRAPLAKFDLSDAEHTAWAESFHGGVCDAHPGVTGLVLPAASVDLTSAFPAVANLIGSWTLRTAARLGREDVTADLRELCRRAAADPSVLLDPAVWQRFGCTLAKVRPNGEPWPIEIEDERRADGRFEVVPVFSPARPMYFAWPAVVAAAVSSGRVPTILSASRLVPEGRQTGLRRRLPVLPGLVLDVDDDPGVALVRHRQKAKAAGDLNLAAESRVVVNSLVFGNLCRFDERRRKEGNGRVIGEVPGPETFLPLASCVTAGSYLLLAVLQRFVADRGGIVAYRDTDSSVLPALPDGGKVSLRDGSEVQALSWSEIDEIVAKFDGLRVFGADVPVWKVERGTAKHPLHTLVAAPKRHVEFVFDDAGLITIVHRTDFQLGGTYTDPPAIPGRAHDGHRLFSLGAIEAEIRYALARERDPENACRPEAAWDLGQDLPFPDIRRLRVGSPAILASLPVALGARVGSGFLQPEVDTTFPRQVAGWSGGGVVALDPGDDLAEWHDLVWLDRRTGARVRATTDRMDYNAVLLVSLAEKAADWGSPSRAEPVAEVHVDPLLVQRLGRVGGVIDAGDAGEPGSLRDRRPVYSKADLNGALRKYLAVWGAPRFASRTGLPRSTVYDFAAGRSLSIANARKAFRALRIDDGERRLCPIDELPIFKPYAGYCSVRCKSTARKRRQRAREAERVVDAEPVVVAAS